MKYMMLSFIKKLKNNSFFSNSKNYLIAEFFNKGIVFITIPFFTRFLIPEEYGLLAIFTSVVSIFTILNGLNLHGAVTRRYYEEDNNFKSFLGSNLLFATVINITILIVGYILKDQIASFFRISGNLFYIGLIVSSLGFFILLELSCLRASQQSKKYAKLSIIRNLLMIIVAMVGVFFLKKDKYMGKVYAQLLSSTIVFIFVYFKLIKKSEYKFNIEHLKYALSFSIPLIPHALSGFILAQFDRIIINQLSGSYETGLYSFAYNIGMIMNVFVISMNRAWSPILFNNLKRNEYDNIEKLGGNYIKITFLISFLLILFSREIVMVMADEKYYKALEIVPLIIMGYVAVFLYTLFSGYTFYRKKTGLISIFTFIAGGTNILLNYIFIPLYGYIAAAWTTLFSYFLLFVLHYINSKFILKENVISISKILIHLTILLVFIFVYMQLNIENNVILIGVKLLILFILFIVFFHKELRSFLQK